MGSLLEVCRFTWKRISCKCFEHSCGLFNLWFAMTPKSIFSQFRPALDRSDGKRLSGRCSQGPRASLVSHRFKAARSPLRQSGHVRLNPQMPERPETPRCSFMSCDFSAQLAVFAPAWCVILFGVRQHSKTHRGAPKPSPVTGVLVNVTWMRSQCPHLTLFWICFAMLLSKVNVKITTEGGF